jgi:hypothetical protein
MTFVPSLPDDADEAWVVQQRGGRSSDAVLSCPGCFTMICMECQQHQKYHTQFRAVTVMNCEVRTRRASAA